MQLSTTPTAPPTDSPARCRVVDHRSAWLDILPGLHALHEQSDAQDWDIEGVRHMLDSGRALLVVDVDDRSAFAVVRIDASPFDIEALELFVYLAWRQRGESIARFQPYFEEMARAANAKYMRFFSRRQGMLKLAMRVGYRPRNIEYVKELQS